MNNDQRTYSVHDGNIDVYTRGGGVNNNHPLIVALSFFKKAFWGEISVVTTPSPEYGHGPTVYEADPTLNHYQFHLVFSSNRYQEKTS